MPYKIPLNKSTLEKDDLDAANEVLYSDRLTMGPLTERFEKEFAEYVGSKYAVFVNSGSSANLLAVFAIKEFLGWKDFTWKVPALTWSTTIHPIIQAGGKPVFKDCHLDTFQTPDCDFAVHLLGNCEAPKNPILEDCCESLGVYYRDRHVGTFGLAGTFSFYFSHHITTIEGGMVVTDHYDFYQLLKSMRSHGWARSYPEKEIQEAFPGEDARFLMLSQGFNLRPTELNAALGLSQLKKLERLNERRRDIFTHWGNSVMRIPPHVRAAPFAYPLKGLSLKAHLEANGIETRPLICGNLLLHPAFKSPDASKLVNATAVHNEYFYIGLSPMLADKDVEYVAEILYTNPA